MVISRHSQHRTLTLLELFVQSSGSVHAHALLSQLQIDEELLPVWHTSMLTYITLIGKSYVGHSGGSSIKCVPNHSQR
jgi:hypothetical protein